MRILIQHGSERLGPFTMDEARAALAAGTVAASDLAWQEGTASWVPLASLLAGIAPTPTAAPGFAPPKPTSGMAIASLVLGITSIVMCLSFLTGIPAIICGHLARGRIKQSGGQIGGEGLALGGLITGYAGTFFTVLLAAIALPAFMSAREAGLGTRALSNGKVIITGCISYAADQVATGSGPGDFPPDLETLVAKEYFTKADLEKVLKVPGDPSPNGWIYLGAKAEDSGNRVVLVTKKKWKNGKRGVVHKGGDAALMRYELPADAAR